MGCFNEIVKIATSFPAFGGRRLMSFHFISRYCRSLATAVFPHPASTAEASKSKNKWAVDRDQGLSQHALPRQTTSRRP
jgi:hypothetical protein